MEQRGYKTDSGNGGYLEYLREEMPAEYTVFVSWEWLQFS